MSESGNAPVEIAGFAIIEARFITDYSGVRRKSKQLSDESCSHLSVIARIGGLNCAGFAGPLYARKRWLVDMGFVFERLSSEI